MSAIDQEKKIAEIREALERAKGKYTVGTIADRWCRFLLSELERLEREYAEECAAHNAHVTELCELGKENRKLREEIASHGPEGSERTVNVLTHLRRRRRG